MIPIEDTLPDKLTDDVGRLLVALRHTSPGRAREEARRALVETAEGKGYLFFVGHYLRYHLTQVGNTYLYRLPESKRGRLKAFRGGLIRISCWHSGRHSIRHLMAGPVDDDQIEHPSHT